MEASSRFLGSNKNTSPASFYWYVREKQKGTVSSNLRFQTVPFQQYSANLSYQQATPGCREELENGWGDCGAGVGTRTPGICARLVSSRISALANDSLVKGSRRSFVCLALPAFLIEEAWKVYPRIPQKRLQTQEETQRKQGDTMCIIVSDVCYRPVFSESLLGFVVSSGQFRDSEKLGAHSRTAPQTLPREGSLLFCPALSRGAKEISVSHKSSFRTHPSLPLTCLVAYSSCSYCLPSLPRTPSPARRPSHSTPPSLWPEVPRGSPRRPDRTIRFPEREREREGGRERERGRERYRTAGGRDTAEAQRRQRRQRRQRWQRRQLQQQVD